MDLFMMVLGMDFVAIGNALFHYYSTRRDLRRRHTSMFDLLSIRDQSEHSMSITSVLESQEDLLQVSCGTNSKYGGYILTSTVSFPDGQNVAFIQKNVPTRFAHTLRGAAAQIYLCSQLESEHVPRLLDVSPELGSISEGKMDTVTLAQLENQPLRDVAICQTLDTLIDLSAREKTRAAVSVLGQPHFSFADFVDVMAHEHCAPPRTTGKPEVDTSLQQRYNDAGMRYYDLLDAERPRLSRSQRLALPPHFRGLSFDQFDASFQEQWSSRYGAKFKEAYDAEIGLSLKHDEFVHGDLHPYNILVPSTTGLGSSAPSVDGSHLTLIDWDKAGYGDLFAELFSFVQWSSSNDSSRCENVAYLNEKLEAVGISVGEERRQAAAKDYLLSSLHKTATTLKYVSSQEQVDRDLERELTNMARCFYTRSLHTVQTDALRNVLVEKFGKYNQSTDVETTGLAETSDSQLWPLIMQSQKPMDEESLLAVKHDVDEKMYRRYARTKALESGFRWLGYSLCATHVMMGLFIDGLKDSRFDTTPLYTGAVLALINGWAVGGGVRKYLHTSERD